MDDNCRDSEITETARGLRLDLILNLPNGLHSRPSAKLAKMARNFDVDIMLSSDRGEADAKSMLDVLSVAPEKGARISLLAKGPDARQALVCLADFLSGKQE